ncbi:hypothetical protein MMC19_006650 [Ptychographa xylographoides]|nr:hypothetical protein [Ptychographa xylographoides]
MNVNANNVVFWLLGRIYSSPEILTGIRNELSSFVLCTEKKCELNIDGITKSCPLLKAAYFECLRMDVVTTTFKKSNADFTITESTSDTFGGPQQTYLIKKGEHIHLAYSLHHTDPRYFSEPGIFRPERFLVEEEGEGGEAKLVAQQGTLRPYGGGHSLCKGYKFAEKEILLIVASVLTTWDAIPVTGEWKLPRQIRASGAYIPAGDWRLRLSRRQ